MLTVTRKVGEVIHIGDDITIVVKEIKGKQVRLGIKAPEEVVVDRAEIRARRLAAVTQPPAK